MSTSHIQTKPELHQAEEHDHHKSDNEHLFEEVIQELKDKHIRITAQREAIIKYLIESETHPTVEQIYQDLLPHHKSLSLATVYNNLKTLVDEGYVYEMKFSDVTSRYDFIRHQHGHIICTKCGRVSDFDIPNISQIHAAAREQTHYLVNGMNLEIRGICPECQKDL
ncbi:Fur family transcriptional regulator [Fundicoccus culcitae]|uniref:Transcriptional repressor n=1 Tax=Fundicoccus culcitae TaxID=2969821 RepID=A0ABY5P604_9LACT|nr:Fur family transcriptional regulator [Fundicoccus culcitae]UUX34146.1 transcriptional repressor [Fundicoccus culcitae]